MKTSDLIPAEDIPFPEKWNMKHKYNLAFKISFIAFPFLPFLSMFCGAIVARMPDAVPRLKEWVEDLVS